MHESAAASAIDASFRGHVCTAFGAAATGASTLGGLRIVQPATGICALFADRSARGACVRMNTCITKHRVCAGAANVGTCSQQRYVVFGRILTAFTQAVTDRLDANRVALRAVCDASIHLRAAMAGRMMGHGLASVGISCRVVVSGQPSSRQQPMRDRTLRPDRAWQAMAEASWGRRKSQPRPSAKGATSPVNRWMTFRLPPANPGACAPGNSQVGGIRRTRTARLG